MALKTREREEVVFCFCTRLTDYCVTPQRGRASVHAKLLHSCWTPCNPMDRPWDSPGKNTGVLPCSPPPRDLPDLGIEPTSPVVPALQADSLPLSHHGSLLWRWGGGGLLKHSVKKGADG